ncbi:hypothetical protein F4X10_23755 [Candidatus Poribacteria bacterium]|nr:hypothetical protein [Candidatus Poribacteria bacterium]
MRFVIIFSSLICLSLFNFGCIGNHQKTSNQEQKPIAGEQNTTATEELIDSGEKSSSKDSQVENNPLETPQQGKVSIDPTVDEAQEHYLAFFSLLKTDIEAAEIELSKYVKTRFGAHPLGDKWVKLFVRLVRNQKGTFADIQHATQWHVQMLTDVKPEERTQAHTELLKDLQEALRGLESIGKLLESQGKDLETYEMSGRFDSP